MCLVEKYDTSHLQGMQFIFRKESTNSYTWRQCGLHNSIERWVHKGDRVKHIWSKFFFTHDLQKDGIITVQQIRSSENLADLFTKTLPTSVFKKLAHGIGLRRLKDIKWCCHQGSEYVCTLFSLAMGFFPLGFSLARFLTRHAIHLLMDIQGRVLCDINMDVHNPYTIKATTFYFNGVTLLASIFVTSSHMYGYI